MTAVCTVLVILGASFLIVKKYKAQAVLIGAGFLLFTAACLSGSGSILPEAQATGFWVTDLFERLSHLASQRIPSMGLNIMAVGGFAHYMDVIGASRALIRLTMPLLRRFRSPYVVMSLAWGMSMFLGLAISSASGLAMLLMVTVYPILVSIGVSRISAAAVIATSLCLDWSPADAMTVYAADLAGMDPVTYWHSFLAPVVVTLIPILALVQYAVQKTMDRRDGHEIVIRDREEIMLHLAPSREEGPHHRHPPLFFAILPVLPLVLVLSFSSIGFSHVRMNLPAAIGVALFVSMILHWIVSKDGRKAADHIQDFFDGMGRQMAHVMTIIIAGEFFAAGLSATGILEILLEAAARAEGRTFLLTAPSLLAAAGSVLMGSGNAAFFSFASLVPDLAAAAGLDPVYMILPMNLIVGSARALSPITGVVVVVSGMAGVSPFELVKRTAIPMAASCLLVLASPFVLLFLRITS